MKNSLENQQRHTSGRLTGQEALPLVSRFSAGYEASAAPHTAAGGHLASAQDPSLCGAGTQTCGGDGRRGQALLDLLSPPEAKVYLI